MTTLIFGGSGFIGRRLADYLTAQGEDVVSADIAPARDANGGKEVPFVRCDIRRYDDVFSAMSSIRPSRTVNLAYMLGSEKPPRVALELNILGMDNYFEASRVAEVEHVVFVSSLAVNGLQTNFGARPVTERDALLGSTYQYAQHKVFNEWQAEDYRKKFGMRITAVRPANVTGHDKIFGSVDHVRCIVEPAHGRSLVLPYADTMRTPVHVDDVARAIGSVTLASRPKHTAYNTGGNTTSLGELAALMRRVVPEADISFEHEDGDRDSCTNYLIDNSRLREEFAFEPLNLPECVERIVADVRRESALVSAG